MPPERSAGTAVRGLAVATGAALALAGLLTGAAGCAAPGPAASHIDAELQAARPAGTLPTAVPTTIDLTAGIPVITPGAGTGTAPAYSELFPMAAAAMAGATGARVRGRLADGAQSVTLDVAGNTAGTNSLASVTDQTGTLMVLVTGGRTYVRATSAYWIRHLGAKTARVIGPRWVTMPATASLGDITVDRLLERAMDTEPTAADLRDSTVTRVDLDGRPALEVVSPDRRRTLYLSASGRPYPIRYLEWRADQTPVPGASPLPDTDLTFTAWDAVTAFGRPPAASVLTGR